MEHRGLEPSFDEEDGDVVMDDAGLAEADFAAVVLEGVGPAVADLAEVVRAVAFVRRTDLRMPRSAGGSGKPSLFS